ncbi:HD domain-containing protein [Brotaphodocola catenula]|uniref:HD domain-containing protein n=2 Tax=Brotaphodocola catenula TaxID=2885361 RepID=A0AAE3DJV4_9FIRM|nr:HD domain-containing protein [Brotaphodocola catenula]MCC2163488.1 HD domain-containing protein [Brotaphodocola catenula]
MKMQLARLMDAMIGYDQGDAKRIQHFVKVHDFATAIGKLEGLDEETQFILESASILHDIGIHISEQKYGSSSGKYQELEGPAEAEKLMREVGGYMEGQMDRIKYLIGHHHTYHEINGMDYQILVEADFLVNLYEDGESKETAEAVRGRIFRTKTGIRFLSQMFGI